jgi:hypothetical protein
VTTTSISTSGSTPETVLAWEDDPGQPPLTREPIQRPLPELGGGPLAVEVAGPVLPPGSDQVGSDEFRYWAMADALQRSADFWAGISPRGLRWNAAVGPALRGTIDAGDDLNAFYDREGLKFFHHEVSAEVTVYSGESPDIVCHELGHAVLDAIRPQLWDAASAEAAAFHESFADISALLSALQLPSVRASVLEETQGVLTRSSRLSRLAEQLGWAIRQVAPNAVEPDCLRNAANRFFYRDPLQLPPSAPASQLSSEVHSFSRVFTGAYLRVIAGIFRLTDGSENALVETAQTAGRLLLTAAGVAPITAAYYAQVAAHVVAADVSMNGGIHAGVIKAAFVRHGILSPRASSSVTSAGVAPHAFALTNFAAVGDSHGELPLIRTR